MLQKKSAPPLLKMVEIEKTFPGVRALDKVSLTVESGTVHALMGENGAGKSTLMKCLFGVYKKDGGRVLLEGKEISFKSSKEALLNGVAMVHQELNQALKLTVMDNMWLGRFPYVSKFVPLTSERKMYSATKRIFDDLGITVDPKAKMSTLSVSQRQMVEIAKAVSYRAKVIVFDEPTSSLTDAETEKLFSIIELLKKNGCGIIYISHKMDEILRISDEITVMRDGKRVETRDADKITTDEIIKLMVGRTLTERYPKKTNRPGKVLLEINALSSRTSRLSDIDLTLREGEILGIAGLDGSGRSELLETVFGLRGADGGTITLKGKKIRNSSPQEAIKNGFALITEERRASGIFGILDICENTTVSGLKKYLRFGLLSDKKRREDTAWAIRSMNIKTASQKTQIKLLSGGNQQKVIIGRWLLTEPEILMLDEPTRGIDVGAKFEIYQLIDALAAKGKSIIVVSSELPELLGICDRIYVMSSGRVAGEVDANDTTQEEIMTLASKYM